MSDILELALQLCVLVSAVTGIRVIGLNRTVRQTVALPVVTVQSALKARPVKQMRKSQGVHGSATSQVFRRFEN